jgi:hypothetical protein
MKTAWVVSTKQSPVGLRTLYIRVKTRPYHFVRPKGSFRTEAEAIAVATSLVQVGQYAKIERGCHECSHHPSYGHWGPVYGSSSHYISPFNKDAENVPRDLIGMQ